MSQWTLLERLVREALPGLEWDGCRLPAAAREALRPWLAGRAMANDLPASWTPVDRDTEDFPAGLLG
jgi:hypothetical protein